MSLQKCIDQFLRDHIDPSRPCLIGLSGGADSMALFHLLLRANANKPALYVVHIDHGWREESAAEAEAVQALCVRFGIPCHIRRLNPDHFSGNLELASREARYQVFREVADDVGAQGIFLGHHMNDQAETVLKRLFEGAGISRLGAMRPRSLFEGLPLFRPLLGIEKSVLEEYLRGHGESFFQDPTNADTRFLRSRMREQIFPFLRNTFGKEFEKNLIRFADSAHEIRSYLEEKVSSYVNEPIESDLGVMYDLSSCELHPVEIKEVVLKAVDRASAVLSRSQMDTAVSFIIQKASNKWLKTGSVELFIDRGRLFVLRPQVPQEPMKCVLRFGRQEIGPYSATIEEVSDMSIVRNHWLDLFQGELCTYLPLEVLSKNAMVCLPVNQEKFSSMKRTFKKGDKTFTSLMSQYKVPLLLRSFAPVIIAEGVIHEDFLLGITPYVTGNLYVKVSLIRKQM